MTTLNVTETTDRRPASSGALALGVVLLTIGILLSLFGMTILTAGVVVSSANQFRDRSGFFSTPEESFATSSYALTSAAVGELSSDPIPNLPFDLATVRLTAEAENSDVFIGIAPRADVDRYLDDVEHAELRSVTYRPFEAEYREIEGSTEPELPAEQDFWAESASGAGTQELDWQVTPGEWRIVIMNADASAGIDVHVRAGVRSDLIGPAAAALVGTGILVLAIGLPLLIVGAILLGRNSSGPLPSPSQQPAGPLKGPRTGGPGLAVGRGSSPVLFVGERDATVSRGLWLVKWLLAIPHYIILVFLWFAFGVTTLVAGFAILFTGRYPYPLFLFNVGVLRWSWRVGFYSYSALGTDKYPPFTLNRADYPADFDVAYPDRLSRGLVLVKWWLLAIPHYLILAAISGPIVWQDRWDETVTRGGLSLVGTLVLIVGVALLFTGIYPRGLFDLLMGINRWAFRVIAYVALLRDDYPPFRLDQGPVDPGNTQAGGPVSEPNGVNAP
ncbi:DUF4389 domain-containing protein [Mycetocola miduiensis]|uniref:DUF4389 domain-containing protein n=1 Tax=Mycetocola miduiensis TaxID=995034 RepID=A0A1I5CVA3_9MICO|nr:DUF4389 domain-containing protein [Mycetocola miduiensis]SFN90894.1 protein of unknown function [Mycetocola miduiensis]